MISLSVSFLILITLFVLFIVTPAIILLIVFSSRKNQNEAPATQTQQPVQPVEFVEVDRNDAKPAAWICSSCGASVEGGGSFCSYCGARKQ